MNEKKRLEEIHSQIDNLKYDFEYQRFDKKLNKDYLAYCLVFVGMSIPMIVYAFVTVIGGFSDIIGLTVGIVFLLVFSLVFYKLGFHKHLK